MKFSTAFNEFLVNTVNLNQTRLDQLEGRVQAIVACLKGDATIGAKYQDHIPQGSWPHKTIIKPLEGEEFDADFLLLLKEDLSWSANPKEYLQQVRSAFKRSATYKDMVRQKTRCVRIVYANDCHVDVVPHLVLADGRQVIINSAGNVFEDTNPQGFTDWMKEKDDLANGNFRRVIRLLKYLRDFKETFSCPSVILTTLLGEHVQSFDAATRYADVPTTLRNLTEDLSSWLSLYFTMPTIEDPSCPGTKFNHRWDEATYENFRTRLMDYASAIAAAYDEPDEAKSLAAWQQIFGPDFVLSAKASTTLQKVATKAIDSRAPFEQFIEELYPVDIRYKARIDCSLAPRSGFRAGPVRRGQMLAKGHSLKFQMSTDTPHPYSVYWKVRNRGKEASDLGAVGLRGQLMPDQGHQTRRESTRYTGLHYIDAYVVKNGRVVAADRHQVIIA